MTKDQKHNQIMTNLHTLNQNVSRIASVLEQLHLMIIQEREDMRPSGNWAPSAYEYPAPEAGDDEHTLDD